MPRKNLSKPTRENLSIGAYGRGAFLLARELGEKGERLVYATSSDGKKFSNRFLTASIVYPTRKKEDISKCYDFKLSERGKTLTLTYLIRNGRTETTVIATATSPKLWKVRGTAKTGAPAVCVPGAKKNDGYSLYFGKDVLRAAHSKDGKRFAISEGRKAAHWRFFDGLPFHIAGAHVGDEGTYVLTGSCLSEDVLNDVNRGSKIGEVQICRIGVALFKKDHPTELEWQTDLPFVDIPIDADKERFDVLGVVSGGAGKNKFVRIYITFGKELHFFEFPERALKAKHAYAPMLLAKSSRNPVMEPGLNAWESRSIFNPAAIKIGEKVHILYRAIGDDGISRLGYACSPDGVHMEDRLKTPALALSDPRSRDVEHRHFDMILYPSGGSWGGCEDPRIVLLDGKIHVTFNMFDGWDNLRVAVIWISLEDFLAKRFWKWSKPIMLSPQGQVHKNWILFPEKINGKFALLHNLHSDSNHKVEIEYVEDLSKMELPKDFKSLDPQGIADRPMAWHKRMRSAGPPPVKTDKGWLLFYHATDRYEPSRYKLGVMLLDLNDPSKVLHRARASILNPDEYYENNGKPGIVYACGAVEMGGTVYVYYGGADRVACVATVKTEELLRHIIKDEDVRFKVQKAKI